MNRYEVRVFRTEDPEDFWMTHTYADNPGDAILRMTSVMQRDPDIWDGWDFSVKRGTSETK